MPQMISLRHHLQIVWCVVVLVAVDVVNDLAPHQRPADLLFSDDTVFVPIVQFSIHVRPRRLAGNSSVAAFGSELLVTGHKISVAITANSLRVHAAQAARIMWLAAALEAAQAAHSGPHHMNTDQATRANVPTMAAARNHSDTVTATLTSHTITPPSA